MNINIKYFLAGLLICLSFSNFAQNSIEETWILPHLKNYSYFNNYALYVPSNNDFVSELEITTLKINNDKISFEGRRFYNNYWNFGDNLSAIYPLEGEITEEVTEEEPAEEVTEGDTTAVWEEVTEEEPAEEMAISNDFSIEQRINQNENQITITFSQNKRLGFLTLYFLNENQAYLKSYHGFDTLPTAEEMKIDLEKNDLPIIYIEKKFKEIQKKLTFPSDDEEKYMEFWTAYLEEVRKEENKKRLDNLGLKFQMNLLGGYHFTTELQQIVFNKLNYNSFASLDSLNRAVAKFAYPEKLRAVIRGETSDTQIESIKDKLNQKWYANIIIPFMGGWEFGYADKEFEEVPEIILEFDIDYPNLGLDWDMKGMPQNTPPPPSQYQSFSLEIQKLTMGTDETNGTLVLLLPANFLDSPREEDSFVVLQFSYLSDSAISFQPLPNEFKTLEEAERQFKDIPKNKQNLSFGIYGGGTQTINLISQKEKDRYDKLPVLEANQAIIDSIINTIITRLEKEKDNYVRNIFGRKYNLEKINQRERVNLLMTVPEYCKEVLISMGYNPSESYKVIIKFQMQQVKYWEIEELKAEIKEAQEKLEEIKTVLAKPDSLKDEEEQYYDEYELEDTQEQLDDLESRLKVAQLKLKLDTLEKTGQGYSKEAENIRETIEFEEKYKRFSYTNNKGSYFLEDLEFTYDEAKNYLDRQKELEKSLTDKQKKKQRKAQEKAEKKRQEAKEKELQENPSKLEIDYTRTYNSEKEIILGDIQAYLEEVTFYLYDIKQDKLALEQFINKYKDTFPERIKPLEEKLENSEEIPIKIQEIMDKLVIIEKEIKEIEEWKDPNIKED